MATTSSVKSGLRRYRGWFVLPPTHSASYSHSGLRSVSAPPSSDISSVLASEQLSLNRPAKTISTFSKTSISPAFEVPSARHIGCSRCCHTTALWIMRAPVQYKRLLLLSVFLLANCSLVFAQANAPQPSAKVLHNGDVLRMNRAGMKPSEIIAKIVTSPCNFDTFPQVLRELKMKGLPDNVVMAMVMVPYGPPASSPTVIPVIEPKPQTARVQIPNGTVIEIESAAPVSSADAGVGDRIKFLVSRRVLVRGVVVIDRGALARAHVVKSQAAGSWGRGGILGWVLEDVVAVDGTRVPIKLSDRLAGKSRRKAVVAAAIATGAVVLPYSTPVGLIWALKKGDEAVLDESRKSTAIVSNNTEVAGLLPKTKKVIYHSTDQLKTAAATGGGGLAPASTGFRPTPIGKH